MLVPPPPVVPPVVPPLIPPVVALSPPLEPPPAPPPAPPVVPPPVVPPPVVPPPVVPPVPVDDELDVEVDVLVVMIDPGWRSGKVEEVLGTANVLCLPTESDWICEIEVHADLLEEVILDGDEADLDRDLQVLEPPQLTEQVGHLVVDLRRVADDQADAQEERRDGTDGPGDIKTAGIAAAEGTAESVGLGDIRTLPVVDLPGARRDRGGDQLDHRRHVNPPTLGFLHAHPIGHMSVGTTRREGRPERVDASGPGIQFVVGARVREVLRNGDFRPPVRPERSGRPRSTS